MADVFTKAKRSAVMARIRGSGNRGTELRLIALVRAHGITGWRRGSKLMGKPDFVFPAGRVAVFVDGPSSHEASQGRLLLARLSQARHEAGRPTPPSGAKRFRPTGPASCLRQGFGTPSRLVTRTLRAMGWRVLRVWEHELARKNEPRLLTRLQRVFASS